MIRKSIKKVIRGEDLTENEMMKAMEAIIDGVASPSQVGSLLTALRMKGETVREITGAAKAIKSRVWKLQTDSNLVNLDRDDINIEEETILETCDAEEFGTNTFNVSTATIFVAAGGGLRVARQGNRASSKFFSTADVLETLGVNLTLSRSDVERCVSSVGIGFMFAPLFQGLMKNVAGLRREMGIRTIFNLIGPLANPGDAASQLLGVYEPELTEKMAHVLNNLGAKEGFVVFGEGTFDEISNCGSTKISHLKNGVVSTYVIEPEDFGLKRASISDIKGGDVRENSRIIKRVLDGEKGPKRDIVLLNAGAAFVVSGVSRDMKEGMERAAASIDSGKAREKLEALIRFTADCAPFVRREFN